MLELDRIHKRENPLMSGIKSKPLFPWLLSSRSQHIQSAQFFRVYKWSMLVSNTKSDK